MTAPCRGPARHPDKCCGQTMLGQALHGKESEMTFYRAVMTTAYALKNNTKVVPSYLIKCVCGGGGGASAVEAPARALHTAFFSPNTQREGEERITVAPMMMG